MYTNKSSIKVSIDCTRPGPLCHGKFVCLRTAGHLQQKVSTFALQCGFGSMPRSEACCWRNLRPPSVSSPWWLLTIDWIFAYFNFVVFYFTNSDLSSRLFLFSPCFGLFFYDVLAALGISKLMTVSVGVDTWALSLAATISETCMVITRLASVSWLGSMMHWVSPWDCLSQQYDSTGQTVHKGSMDGGFYYDTLRCRVCCRWSPLPAQLAASDMVWVVHSNSCNLCCYCSKHSSND